MVNASEEQLDIRIKGNHKLNQVEQFEYIGSVISIKEGVNKQ